MPRAGTSSTVGHAKVIDYFKTAPLETADLVLSLVTAEVRGRKQKSLDAKAAQKKAKGKTNAAPAPAAESDAAYAGEEA